MARRHSRARRRAPLTPPLQKSNAGSDRAWCFTAQDFADGELKEEVFAIKFRDSEAANAFKAAYDKAAESNLVLYKAMGLVTDSDEAAAGGGEGGSGAAASEDPSGADA